MVRFESVCRKRSEFWCAAKVRKCVNLFLLRYILCLRDCFFLISIILVLGLVGNASAGAGRAVEL